MVWKLPNLHIFSKWPAEDRLKTRQAEETTTDRGQGSWHPSSGSSCSTCSSPDLSRARVRDLENVDINIESLKIDFS